jgi:hypothetical protein
MAQEQDAKLKLIKQALRGESTLDVDIPEAKHDFRDFENRLNFQNYKNVMELYAKELRTSWNSHRGLQLPHIARVITTAEDEVTEKMAVFLGTFRYHQYSSEEVRCLEFTSKRPKFHFIDGSGKVQTHLKSWQKKLAHLPGGLQPVPTDDSINRLVVAGVTLYNDVQLSPDNSTEYNKELVEHDFQTWWEKRLQSRSIRPSYWMFDYDEFDNTNWLYHTIWYSPKFPDIKIKGMDYLQERVCIALRNGETIIDKSGLNRQTTLYNYETRNFPFELKKGILYAKGHSAPAVNFEDLMTDILGSLPLDIQVEDQSATVTPTVEE